MTIHDLSVKYVRPIVCGLCYGGLFKIHLKYNLGGNVVAIPVCMCGRRAQSFPLLIPVKFYSIRYFLKLFWEVTFLSQMGKLYISEICAECFKHLQSSSMCIYHVLCLNFEFQLNLNLFTFHKS
jgi:hypothetical protein